MVRSLVITVLAASTSIASAGKPTLVFDKVSESGKAAAKTVVATLERSNAKLLACYKHELVVPRTEGDVTATFAIEADRRVATASAPGGTPLGSRGGYNAGAGRSAGSGYRRIPVKKTSASLGTPKVRGSDLDAAIIRRYVKRYITRVSSCYEKELAVTPGIAGNLIVDFAIGADGKVTTATAKGVHANVEACVASAIQNIEFPKPKTPNGVVVSYPITFKP